MFFGVGRGKTAKKNHDWNPSRDFLIGSSDS
jgi:hypothetical protein